MRLDPDDRRTRRYAFEKLFGPCRVKVDFAVETQHGFSIHAGRRLREYGVSCWRGSGGEGAAQTLIGGCKFLGLDPRFADRGHEIGVPDPARQNVQVQMSGDTGSRGPAYVDAYVVAIGAIQTLERPFDALRESHHFGEGLWFGLGERRPMRIRNYHHVP